MPPHVPFPVHRVRNSLGRLSLRSEYGNPRKYLSDPSKYMDLKYYEMARATG
jgi:hypothetical protein